jgi:hypothetical protein
MRGHRLAVSLVAGFGLSIFAAVASAGTVNQMFRGGAFGLQWSASKSAIQAKYPGGKWDTDETGGDRYCAPSKQSLLSLPAQHQTRELCFLMGKDGTLGSVTANMNASLQSLLAVVNRSRTMFGDFDAVRRDEGAIQSRFTYMLWTKDSPIVVMVGSANDADGRPNMVAFTVADDASVFTSGAEKVANRPAGSK